MPAQSARTKKEEKHEEASENGHSAPKPVRTLAVDVGGTGIKTVILNELGDPVSERGRVKTPDPATPGAVLDAIATLAAGQGEFDRVSVGFPGVVRRGVVLSAPKLSSEWVDFNIGKLLSAKFGEKPVRIANDADVQGFGAISGKGVELVVTLGTGVGSALFIDGRLVPNVEVGKDKLCDAELARVGKKKWNKRLAKLVQNLDEIFHFDRLYIGGGNAKHADLTKLPANVTLVSNLNGLVGGIALWRDEPISGPTGSSPID